MLLYTFVVLKMPKGKLEDQLEEDWADIGTKIKTGDKKNSLDSDEDDDGEGKAYDILSEGEIEGQEEGAVGFDGEVAITPFNMKEELEEGHFDTEGNYHWKKEGKIKDNWLENIDWVKIKKIDGQTQGAEEVGNDSGSDYSSNASPFDRVSVYKQMLELMKPGESVAKSLRRLGGNKRISASERWRRKKAGQEDSKQGNQQQVIELTELANRLLTKTGNMDIYQESYEHIASLISNAEKQNVWKQSRPTLDYEDALDMYAVDFDEKEKARMEQQAKKKNKGEEAVGVSCMESGKQETGGATGNGIVKMLTSSSQEENQVMWEFKWEEKSTDIHGPHTTSQMQAWVDQGYFSKSVLVRKCGTDGQFYNSSRVDFELYL
ncbi:CD2 antigen cytoplasmic tail-binding protein 2 homolog isoform X2 [Cryptotermes secundus]|uniref:CD2 antigen cytoplasmic tail-binding protein 2 homolog isoform X2 n=1 Tax=Cryptotermes secundus TaxID=105785 RepID=UPI000CD7D0FA|nr:CD2 antigen cytoplasmic tail-binding protein 2 homolog isoform X2 [Cryptotermes secundus]